MTSHISKTASHRFFEAGREQRRPRSQRAANSLVITSKRPENAGAHKRRRRTRPENESWQLIYSTIRTYHLNRQTSALLLALYLIAHTMSAAGQQAHNGAHGHPSPRDHFNYYQFPPISSTSNTSMSQLYHQTTSSNQRPSHRSQSPVYEYQQTTQKPFSRRGPTRAETNNESYNHERNAWVPMAASSNRATGPIKPPRPVRGRVQQPKKPAAAAAARLQMAASSEQQSSASAALLDYPQQLPHRHQQRPRSNGQSRPPAAANQNRARANVNHHHVRNRTRETAASSGGGGRQARGREIQLAQDSHIYQHRNNYPPPPPPPMHTSTHHYHHHHHHHFSPPPHRTPRYQQHSGPLDNELGGGGGGAPLETSTKMYKRVLLCDKTLVSLDYIRTLDAEPRPFGPASSQHKKPSINFASYQLNDHEIDEITDNFLDLDGNFDSSLARSSSMVAAAAASNSNSTTNSTTITLDESPTSPVDRMVANDTSSGASTEIIGGIGADLAEQEPTERRGQVASLAYRDSLLNDHDPLVRCDMWDLEKGLKSRKPPAHILRMAIRADFDTVRDAINRCRQLSERTLPPEDEYRGDGNGASLGTTTLELMSTEDLVSLFSMKRGLMPGTKWCGLGDQAETYNDLGPKHRIDICCRAHDHCPIRSKPFRNDYGVLNFGLYTKSHCDCDADFYRCLREVRSRTADMLGNLYFNVMKLQCMREERLKVCRKMKPLALGFERCVRYEDSPVATVFKFTTPPVAY